MMEALAKEQDIKCKDDGLMMSAFRKTAEKRALDVVSFGLGSDAEVGGKGESLLKLSSLGMPLARGFVLPASAFEIFLKENGLEQHIGRVLKKGGTEAEKSAKLKEKVEAAEMPQAIVRKIKGALSEAGLNEESLIVRSSATVEDSKSQSFAGQFDTKIDVKPADIIKAVSSVYASLYNERAIRYMRGEGPLRVKMAVVVQEMVNTDFAGVVFTQDPSGGKDGLVLEYVQGLGEQLVSGSVEPFSIKINRKSMEVLSERKQSREAGGEAQTELSHEKVLDIARLALDVEKEYGVPMDIEFGVKQGKVYLFQARPITTFVANEDKGSFTKPGYTSLQGIPASPGIAEGRAFVLTGGESGLANLKDGEILVCPLTYINYLPDMLKARGIVTELGGITSHAAIVAREHGIPGVVGASGVLNAIKSGDRIAIDGSGGRVYFKGRSQRISLPEEAQDIILEKLKPYKLALSGTLLKASSDKEFLASPDSHVIVEDLGDLIIIHEPKGIRLEADQLHSFEKAFKKELIARETNDLIHNSDNKYNSYLTYAFATHLNPIFTEEFKRMKEAAGTSHKIDAFAKHAISECKKLLGEAEAITRRPEAGMAETYDALVKIYEAGVYFYMLNPLLVTGYGMEHLRNMQKGSSQEKSVNKRMREDISGIYGSLSRWKSESGKMVDLDKVASAADKAVSLFASQTGREIKTLMSKDYRPGNELEKRTIELIRNLNKL